MAATPNFAWPTPDDTDQLSDGAAAIRTLGSAIDEQVYTQSTALATAVADIATNTAAIATNATAIAARLPLTGGTLTGELDAPNVYLGTTSGTADTIALDFSDGNAYVSRTVSGTAVTITGSGYAAGHTKTVRLVVGATAVDTLTVPADWTFVGTAAGTAIGTATTAVITATAFGTAATDVVAGFAESV